MPNGNGIDIFAEIAATAQKVSQDNLVSHEPPALMGKKLPIKHLKSAEFSPASKVDTPAKLRSELVQKRNQYAKFLKDLSPALRSKRSRLMLKTFQYRQETASDKKNITHVFHGRGRWETVTVPHYGGPIGKAVSYYRCKFDLSPAMKRHPRQYVCFKGVDYKAQVYVNGQFLGANEGFFAPFEFDFTHVAKAKGNVLVVKVENDAICMGNRSWQKDGGNDEGDKIYAATGPGWDEAGSGWHHCPPGMGIYQDVTVEGRPDIFINDIFVLPNVEQNKAQIWLEAFNCENINRDISFELSIFGRNFKKTALKPSRFNVDPVGPGVNFYRFSVDIASPRLWSPEQPWLYQVHVKLLDSAEKTLDTQASHFGMRSFTMDTDSSPRGTMAFNGNPIKLRGANTMGHLQQCVIKKNFKQLIDDILLAKICNLNFFRLTQRPVQSEIYDYCDMLGMMTQTDLPLFGVLRRNQFVEAVRQAGQMERLVRSHPCNIMISYINEPFPNGRTKAHRNLTPAELADFFEAATRVVKNLNPDRVIKPVDGDYDPPSPGMPDNHCYCGWYNGHGVDLGRLHKGYWQATKPGWVYGCGEFGVEGLDPVGLMRKYYPPRWLPQNKNEEANWSPLQIDYSQVGDFHYLWFETQHTLKDWVRESQEHQRWVVRLMTEAFRRDNRMHSIALHLLIDAFPAGWMKAVMDCRRKPKPAFFAYKDALEPLMVSIRSDRDKFFAGGHSDFELWLCNDTNETPGDLRLHYQVEVDGNIIVANKVKATVSPQGSECQGRVNVQMPDVKQRTGGRIAAALIDRSGTVVTDKSMDFEVFPAVSSSLNTAVCPIGKEAAVLAKQLNIPTTRSKTKADVFLVSDADQYKKSARRIDSLVKSGRKIVFLEMKKGTYKVCGHDVSIIDCGMGKRHFADANTGHELVKGFQTNDFKWWYNEKRGYVTPFLYAVLEVNNFTPVVYAGNGYWKAGPWSRQYAVAETDCGKGKLVVCQLDLTYRCQSNPVAAQFAHRLLTF